MKRTKHIRRLAALICTAALTLSLFPAAAATGTPAQSSNIHKNDYSTWSKPVTSYLYPNGSGLTRVEYTGGQVIVEDYDSAFQLQSSRSISPELPLWGGFFAGSDYNFLVFGQQNSSESDSTEVIRVVKYDKDWNRLGAASLNGANTTVPFDGGSLRCDEYGGYLYIRTCHEMYTNPKDGLNHQSNLTMAVRQSDMSVTDAYYDVMNIDYGYVSHSFNQFLLVDEEGKIIALDHGDAYPRSAVLTGYYSNASTGSFSGSQYGRWCWNLDLQTFAGQIGANTTGASVGGLAETTNGYVMAYNYDGSGGRGDRYVYYHYMDKASGKSWQYKLTETGGSTTPVVAPTGLNGGYVLWNSKSGSTVSDTLSYITYDAGGTPSYPIQTAQAPLSDCQPIPYNGGVVWYVTDGSTPTFYTLDSAGVTAHPTGGSQEEPTPSTTPSSTPSVTPAPSTTPTPSPTPNVTPTPAPTPSATPTATPTPSQQPSGSGAPLDPRSAPTLAEAVERADILAGRFISGYEPYIDSVDVFAAVDANGTLWGWGDSQCLLGKPGDEVKQPVSLMEQVRQVTLVKNGSVCAILAVKEDNTLWGWGNLGPLGYLNGWDDTTSTPMKLMDDVKSACGAEFGAMVVKQDGTLWFLGSPTDGEDGSGTWYSATADRPAGVYKVMDQVDMVACGFRRFAALKTDGSVWVWGADGYSGDGKLICWLGDHPQKPTKILDNIISIGMDEENGWAIDANGGLWSWGINEDNEVGNGGSYDTTDPFTYCHAQVKPVKILDSGVISASLGMAVTQDGTCYRWSTLQSVQEQYRSTTPKKTGSNMVIASEYVRPDGELLATNRDNIDLYNGDPSTRMKLVHFMDGFFQPQAGSQTDPNPAPSQTTFSDVPSGAWYAEYAGTAASAGLMKGTGQGRFSPNQTLSVAEVVTLTARLYAEDHSESVPAGSGAWYQGAYDYCLSNGLFTSAEVPLSSMTNTATRYLMVELMDRAVPEREKQATKTLSDGYVPDLRESDPYGDVVYTWYRAGILEGDSAHRFNGSTQITRAETAAILCRLAGLTPRV